MFGGLNLHPTIHHLAVHPHHLFARHPAAHHLPTHSHHLRADFVRIARPCQDYTSVIDPWRQRRKWQSLRAYAKRNEHDYTENETHRLPPLSWVARGRAPILLAAIASAVALARSSMVL